MKPYYYVYRYGHHGPQVQHPSVISAQKESIRLAEQHPKSTFEILKCVGVTKATKAQTFWMDREEPEELTRLAPPTQKFNSHYEPIGYPVTTL